MHPHQSYRIEFQSTSLCSVLQYGRKLLPADATYGFTVSTTGDVDALINVVSKNNLMVALDAAVQQFGVDADTAGEQVCKYLQDDCLNMYCCCHYLNMLNSEQ